MMEPSLNYGVTTNVLGFQEDGEWCALALEMDLRGYGRTFDEALEDLHESVAMQISFAHFKGDMNMIFHPAEAIYFTLFAQVRTDRMIALTSSIAETESEYAVAGMPIPPAHVIDSLKDQFTVSDG